MLAYKINILNQSYWAFKINYHILPFSYYYVQLILIFRLVHLVSGQTSYHWDNKFCTVVRIQINVVHQGWDSFPKGETTALETTNEGESTPAVHSSSLGINQLFGLVSKVLVFENNGTCKVNTSISRTGCVREFLPGLSLCCYLIVESSRTRFQWLQWQWRKQATPVSFALVDIWIQLQKQKEGCFRFVQILNVKLSSMLYQLVCMIWCCHSWLLLITTELDGIYWHLLIVSLLRLRVITI